MSHSYRVMAPGSVGIGGGGDGGHRSKGKDLRVLAFGEGVVNSK